MTIDLTNDWQQETPLAFLVRRYRIGDEGDEYRVFTTSESANRFAEEQQAAAEEVGEQIGGWKVYPLYAGHGKQCSENLQERGSTCGFE